MRTAITVTAACVAAAVLGVPLAAARGSATQRNNTNLIDLVQVGLNSPSKLTPGKKFRILDRVENQGEAGALPTVTYFYLSTDDQLDDKDLLIGGRRVPGLGPGQSHEEVTSVALDARVPSGDYFLFVVCDATRQMDERYENNNMRTIKVRVLAAAS